MKLTIDKASLLTGLQSVQNVVSVHSTLPILSNALLSAEEEGLVISVTDLEVSVRCKVAGTVEKGGSTTIPVRRLSSIVRELPESTINWMSMTRIRLL